MKLNTYLSFNGDCKEAMSFYRDCLSGTFDSVKYFADGPEEIEGHKITEELKDNVMHMTWRFGDDNIVMASDSIGQDPSAGKIKLSLTMDDPGQMNQIFEKMSLCGQIIMPLADTFWGARFGMLTDKYGMNI